MLNLILKDFMIQKKSFLIAFVYSFLALFVFRSDVAPGGSLYIGAVAIAYMLVTYGVSYDDKNNTHMALNSLPIKRHQIVLSKYISVFIFGIIGVLMMMVSGVTLSIFGANLENFRINLKGILTVFMVLALIYSIYFPLYFKFGSIKMNILNVLLLMGAMFVPSFLMYLSEKFPLLKDIMNSIKSLPQDMFTLFQGLSALALLLISYVVSVRIYRVREF